ncbi:MAG: ribose 5-phosphate isomerase B [Acidimicrobiia bacterium]|nr:ribose 5-phosphate isomerase B [Acidimicrobiia bacterium]
MAPSEAEIRDVVRQVVAGYTRSSPPLTATSATPPAFSSPSRSEIGTIAVGADHGGYALKERIAFRLRESGREVIDCGTDSTESVDYPDFAHAVASRVASGEAASGIIIDGAGIGSAMVANKVPGVRAALCYDISSARNSREHNHANVLTLGAGLIGSSLAQQIVETWLETPWGPGRHADRVAKINAIEHRYAATSTIGTTRT